MIFGKIKKIHFVGIGGIGMSGIAELLLNLGFQVSGSDISLTEITNKLRQKGAIIHSGHGSNFINDCDVLVYSSAVNLDNPEIQSAKQRGIPVIRRAEMLGELLKLKTKSIAVAGTHGKTTTTSMIGRILTEANLDPTIVVGGIVKSLDVNALLGSGEVIVVEADEFDRSFLQLQPTHAIITTIDRDHMECYEGEEDLLAAFTQFANAVPFYGTVIACRDDKLVQRIIPNISRPKITYGFSPGADLVAEHITYHEIHTEFYVRQNGNILGQIHLQVPGDHNIKNALASIALCMEMNIEFGTIQKGLAQFTGVRRRFDIKGIFNDIMVVDDYAHHPTEVAATVEGIKKGWDRRLVCVFQPHLYSRTQEFFEEFAHSFKKCDLLVVTDVYPAREDPIEGVTGKLIVNAAKMMENDRTYWIEDKENIVEFLKNEVMPGDMVITMGAGDIWKYCDQFVDELSKLEVAV